MRILEQFDELLDLIVNNRILPSDVVEFRESLEELTTTVAEADAVGDVDVLVDADGLTTCAQCARVRRALTHKR